MCVKQFVAQALAAGPGCDGVAGVLNALVGDRAHGPAAAGYRGAVVAMGVSQE
jgi:hypothetical protein